MTERATESGPEEKQFTIDELAAESGVPSRTIRFYQGKGVLGAPLIKGRVAYYKASHVQRLELIAQLQDRGLRIDAIRDLVTRIDRGELDVKEWLGLSAELRAPWAEDQPRTLDEAGLLALAGSKRAGLVADLVRYGAAERRGDVYLVQSPQMLAIAMKLERAGIDLGIARKAEEMLRKHLSRATHELAAHFVERTVQEGNVEPRVAIEALRGIGPDAVRLVFAQEMEKVLRELVVSGRSTKLAKRKKR